MPYLCRLLHCTLLNWIHYEQEELCLVTCMIVDTLSPCWKVSPIVTDAGRINIRLPACTCRYMCVFLMWTLILLTLSSCVGKCESMWWLVLSPFLTWRMFVRPNLLRTLRRTMIRFLIELCRIWFGQSKLYFILNWLVMRCKLRPELAADAQQIAWSKT